MLEKAVVIVQMSEQLVRSWKLAGMALESGLLEFLVHEGLDGTDVEKLTGAVGCGPTNAVDGEVGLGKGGDNR